MAESSSRVMPYGSLASLVSISIPQAPLLSASRISFFLFLLLSLSTTIADAAPQASSVSPTPTQVPTMAPADFGSSPGTPTSIDTTSDNSNPQPFNYFFLIIAAFALFLIIGILSFSRKRRMRRIKRGIAGQRALARDVEGWGRLGRGWREPGQNTYGNVRAVHRGDAGLDERGEAPPTYEDAAADKPPSLRHVERQVNGSVDIEPATGGIRSETGVELAGLPAYDTTHDGRTRTAEAGPEVAVDLQRPSPAVVAGGNIRRSVDSRRSTARDETAT